MKRISAFLAACCLLLGLCVMPAFAANRVPELSIDVALRPDGSAYITQEFSAYTDEGTEFYLDYQDSGYLTITDFSVSDENGAYTVLPEGEWDVEASFADKAGKCGMLPIDGGTELCWGITEYGEHRYTLEYVLHDLVGAYSDMDGFNYRFVNAYLGFFPTDAVVTIRNQDGAPLTDDSCDIWVFGFEGQIQFEDGVIRAWTEAPLEDSANMTILVGVQKGVLSPARTVDDSFEALKERAFDGSDYAQDDSGFLGVVVIIGLILAFFVIGWLCGLIVRGIRKAKRKRLEKQADYFRDAPNNGDLNVTYVLGSKLEFCPDGAFLGARILRLITLGSMEPERTAGKEVSLRLVKEPHQGDQYDEALYTFLQAASGEDGILQAKELEKFCKNSNREKCLCALVDKCAQDGVQTLARQGCLKSAACTKLRHLTPEGLRQLGELLGLKRYLLDFSLLAERNVSETFLWQDYMVYAMLFGIARQVTEQLKSLYPQQLSQIEEYQHYIEDSYRYDAVLSLAAARERERQREAERARAGSGGSASLDGGGGFSGGGGGGTR